MNRVDQRLIQWRILGLSASENFQELKICQYHESLILAKYSRGFKFCCNPYDRHKKNNDYRLSLISLELAEDIKNSNVEIHNKLIPGKKICSNCLEKLMREQEYINFKQKNAHNISNTPIIFDESNNIPNQDAPKPDSAMYSNEVQNADKVIKNDEAQSSLQKLKSMSEMSECTDSTVPSSEEFLPSQEHENTLQVVLNVLNKSPIKLHGMHQEQQKIYAKRKYDEICLESEENFKRMFKIDNLNLSPEIQSYHQILSELKYRFDSATNDQKVQILTIVVGNISIADIQKIFNTTYFLIQTAIKLKEEKGILAVPDPRLGKKLTTSVISKVVDFYCSDRFSHVRLMPGRKDCVSISKGVYEQKRILLSNLRELYKDFKTEYPDEKIGFSKFCSLRPKFCILPGASGTHSVCVCVYHQNFKLLLQAVDKNIYYRDLISQIVCDTNSKECMSRQCLVCNKSPEEL